MRVTRACPSSSFPNTTCFPSSHGVSAVVMKNWGGGGGGHKEEVVVSYLNL